MKQMILGISLIFCWVLATGIARAAHIDDSPLHRVGTLQCRIIPGTGISLLIHSTRDVRCIFTPVDGGPAEHYKGETGIRLGLDININKRTRIVYAVLANHIAAGQYQLAGTYTGAGGGITLGASVGNTAPIRKRDRSIALQPIQTENRGAGATAGFTYLYLEADRERK